MFNSIHNERETNCNYTEMPLSPTGLAHIQKVDETLCRKGREKRVFSRIAGVAQAAGKGQGMMGQYRTTRTLR